jgi:hypothetical protein
LRSNGLLVDIRNVSNRGVRFNANPEPILAFGIVPSPGGHPKVDRSFTAKAQEAKADIKIAGSFSMPWRAPVQQVFTNGIFMASP